MQARTALEDRFPGCLPRSRPVRQRRPDGQGRLHELPGHRAHGGEGSRLGSWSRCPRPVRRVPASELSVGDSSLASAHHNRHYGVSWQCPDSLVRGLPGTRPGLRCAAPPGPSERGTRDPGSRASPEGEAVIILGKPTSREPASRSRAVQVNGAKRRRRRESGP